MSIKTQQSREKSFNILKAIQGLILSFFIKMDKSVITQEELENVAKVYDRIRALYRKKLPE